MREKNGILRWGRFRQILYRPIPYRSRRMMLPAPLTINLGVFIAKLGYKTENSEDNIP